MERFESLPISIGWNSTLLKVDGSAKTLSKLFPKEKLHVTLDLSILRHSHILDSIAQTLFELCADFEPFHL